MSKVGRRLAPLKLPKNFRLKLQNIKFESFEKTAMLMERVGGNLKNMRAPRNRPNRSSFYEKCISIRLFTPAGVFVSVS